MTLRETGSISLSAPRDRVFAVLQERMRLEPGVRTVRNDRIESLRTTFVLRDESGGTRVVMARLESGPMFPATRDDLRSAVSQELLTLQKLVR